MTYGIHILVGRGKNCTCYDCSVLYGGKCYTTKDNNLLDKIEKDVIAYFILKNGKDRKVSDWTIDNAIEVCFKKHLCTSLKLKKQSEFYNKYYCCLPLLFLMMTKLKPSGMFTHYRRTRYHLYRELIKELKETK